MALHLASALQGRVDSHLCCRIHSTWMNYRRASTRTQVIIGQPRIVGRRRLQTVPSSSQHKTHDAPRQDDSEQQQEEKVQHRDECWTVLKDFTAAEFKGVASTTYLGSKESRACLRNAFLRAITSRNDHINWDPASSPVILGILSSDVRLAIRSLRDYTQALSVEFVLPESSVPLPTVQGPVYIRYKSNRKCEEKNEYQQCTLSSYSGNDRGVLVQLGMMQVGHLPLGLLDEGMEHPAPPVADEL